MKVNGDEPGIVDRTFEFAVRIVRLVNTLGVKPGPGRILGAQLLRSGTSIGANVQEAQGGQSRRDFIAKMSIAQKEARETVYWIRLLIAAEILPESKLCKLLEEAERINRILARILLTAKRRTADSEP